MPDEIHYATPDVAAEEPSALDRAIPVPVLTATSLIAAAAVVAAALLRLIDLERWALDPPEARIALAARNLVRGVSVPDDMLGRPFVIEWTALFMFLGDTNETVGRVAMAVAGIAGVVALLGLRRWIGNGATLATLVLLGLSPTLVAASRQMDGGVLLFTLSVVLLVALHRMSATSNVVWSTLAGVSTALLLLSGPYGVVALVSVAAGFVALGADDAVHPAREAVAGSAAGFVATFLLMSSALLTQPAALIEAPLEAITLLWSEHISSFGADFYLVFWNLLLNEPLLIILGITALIAGWSDARTRRLGIWSAATILLVALLGNPGIEAFVISVLPLGLLAGRGADGLIERLPVRGQRLPWAGAYVVALILLGFAFLSAAGLAQNDVGRSAGESLVRFVLVVAVAIVPLGLLLAWAGRRLEGHRLRLVLVALLVFLGAITLRAAVLSASEWTGEPGNITAMEPMGDGIPVIVERIHKISRDLTRTERDARMPVGGIGLRISVDESIAQPFAWYFREYPNFVTFDPDEGLPEGSQIVLLAGDRDADALAPGLNGTTYIYRYDAPAIYTAPEWGDLASGLFDINGWRAFGKFMLRREPAEPVPATEFQLRAISVIASAFTGESGPYALDDRAGAGSSEGQFNQPRGIATDSDGYVYVVDAGNTRVQRFEPGGDFDLVFGGDRLARFAGGSGGPGGIAIGSNGDLFVADTWNHQIVVFSPTGEFIRAWGAFYDAQDDPAAASEQPGAFYGPRGIAIHDGLVYVTDTGNERVQVFTEQGEFVRMFGSFGSGQGQLIEPVGIAVSPDGVVLVADSHNARVARFTLEGEPLESWPVSAWSGQQFFEPYLTLAPDGRLFASSPPTGQILAFDSEGEEIETISDPEVRRPYGLAIAADDGALLVTDGVINAVVRVPLDSVES